jgi:hypothetical protein
VHIHLVDFRILSRNGSAVYSYEQGPKDVDRNPGTGPDDPANATCNDPIDADPSTARGLTGSMLEQCVEQGLEIIVDIEHRQEAGDLKHAFHVPVAAHSGEVEPAMDAAGIVHGRQEQSQPGRGQDVTSPRSSTSSVGREAVCRCRYPATDGTVAMSSSPARCTTHTSDRGKLAVRLSRRGRSEP